MPDLETEVELLKSKVSDTEKLHVLPDDAITKISEVSNCINRKAQLCMKKNLQIKRTSL